MKIVQPVYMMAQVEKTLLYIALALFVTIVFQVNPVRSQNANERDIQLPTPADSSLPSLFIIGDSTVRNGSGDGANNQWGWGDLMAAYFDLNKINVVNRALGGRSSRTYITQGYWDKMLPMLQPDDIVLIQFGHNDGGAVNDTSRARGVLEGIGDEEKRIHNLLTDEDETVYTYGEYLRKYISDIRAKGAQPIICSLVPRDRWENGTVIRNENNFAEWAEAVAKAENVAFIDLNEIIARQYEELGPEVVTGFFAEDGTHTNRSGAKFTARQVVAGIKGLNGSRLEHYFSEKASGIEPLPSD